MFEPNAENFLGGALDQPEDFDHLRKALEKTKDHWSWMIPLGGPGSPGRNFRNGVNQVLANLDNAVAGGRTYESTVEDLKVQVVQNRIIFPTTGLAAHIEDIRDTFGDQAGAEAYALIAGWASPGEMNTLASFQALLAVALPQFLEPQALADRLSKERQNYRSAAARLAEAVEAEADERRAQWDAFGAEAARSARVYFLRRTRRLISWRRNQGRLIDQDRANIQAVEAAFKEQMLLKAPVKYWNDKASGHRAAETRSFWTLVVYFLASFGALGVIYWRVADYVLGLAETAETPIYVVLSAGLATVTGLLIWAGRLVTRLYLSEHHLRKDAEERATMTTTYLALTENGAASDADRQIILAALFRNTADGIVRDDGAPDLTLQSLIARAMTPQR